MFGSFHSEVNLICIVIVSFEIFFALKDIDKSLGMRLFVLCFFAIDLSFIFDAVYCAVKSDVSLAFFTKTLNQCYFFTSGAGALLWFLYSEFQLDSNILASKKGVLTACVPFLIRQTAAFSGYAFYFDRSGLHFGSFYWVLIAIDYGYLIAAGVKAFVKFLNKANYLKKNVYFALSLFSLLSLIALVLQSVLKLHVQLVFAVQTVCCIIIYQKHLEKLISKDPLTGISNRVQLVQYLSERIKTNADSLYLIMMDIDGLRFINEKFGHVQGDEALLQISQTLKATVPRNFLISRYGGDEFVVVGEISSEEQVLVINNGIMKNLERFNYENEREWNVSLSIGYAKFLPEKETLPDFIVEAQKALAEAKKHRAAKDS